MVKCHQCVTSVCQYLSLQKNQELFLGLSIASLPFPHLHPSSILETKHPLEGNPSKATCKDKFPTPTPYISPDHFLNNLVWGQCFHQGQLQISNDVTEK